MSLSGRLQKQIENAPKDEPIVLLVHVEDVPEVKEKCQPPALPDFLSCPVSALQPEDGVLGYFRGLPIKQIVKE